MIAVIDYRAGNLTSVRLALEGLGVDALVTDAPDEVRSADRVIFPGVGAAGSAMENLRELGLVESIRDVVAAGKPFLGICIGTQLALEFSEEDGGTPCIGLLPGRVEKFRPSSPFDKVPQMGWNAVSFRREHPVLAGIDDGSEFYFVHSYYPAPADPGVIIGETDYAGVTFASALARDNLIATQFHPEKSGKVGLKLLENFSRWDGSAC